MFKKLWDFLTEENYSTKSHTRGFLLLLLLSFIILSLPLFWDSFYVSIPIKENDVNLAQLKKGYKVYLDSVDSVKTVIRKRAYKKNKKSYLNHNSPKVYRPYSDGSNRYHVSQVLKGSDDRNYQKKKSEILSSEVKKFNLNTATKEDLVSVKGIGDYYASRILKFRDKLGGFYTRDQLYEVYGLDSSVVEECFKHLNDSKFVVSKKMAINSDSFKVVLRHPYLDYEDVKNVFKYRPISESKLCRIFPNKCERIKPYVDF